MVDPVAGSLVAAAGRSVPPDARSASAASQVAGSTDRPRSGWRWATALCRGAIPVAVCIEAAADGNCHRVVPARGTAAEARRVDHHAGRPRDPGPAPPIDWTAVPRARRLPPGTGSGHDLARRSRQAGARAPQAWGEGPVRAPVSAARTRFPRSPSSRVLSAMRRRGRSLHNLLRCQTTRMSATLKYQLHRVCSIAYGDWGCAASVQLTLFMGCDRRRRPGDTRRYFGNRRVTAAARRRVELTVGGRRPALGAARDGVCY